MIFFATFVLMFFKKQCQIWKITKIIPVQIVSSLKRGSTSFRTFFDDFKLPSTPIVFLTSYSSSCMCSTITEVPHSRLNNEWTFGASGDVLHLTQSVILQRERFISPFYFTQVVRNLKTT
jgi:hypothetical protein